MKRLMNMAMILVIMLVLCACGAKAGTTWQEQYDLGVRYLSEDNYEEAVIAFTAAIEIDAKRVEAYMGRGDAYAGTAEALLGAVEDENNLPQEVIEAWEKTVADYLAAIELDDMLVDAYAKAAQIYNRLGDDEAAIALLEKGIERTGDEGLQALLEELRNTGELLVEKYIAHYYPDGSMCGETYFYYDEMGYILRMEEYHGGVSKNRLALTTYVYEGEPGHCWYIPPREWYDTDAEWEAAKEEDWNKPGESRIKEWCGTTTGYIEGDTSDGIERTSLFCTGLSPMSYEKWAKIRQEDGHYYNEKYDGARRKKQDGTVDLNSWMEAKWHHAIFTFDDEGHPIASSTYFADGTLAGTAVIEWMTIKPVTGE